MEVNINVVRWGVLSTANIAQEFVLPALKQAENAEIAAIASSNPAVNQVASTFGISTMYKTYEELLEDDNIDAVYIPLANSLHAEWVKKAAEKGKHILCEKPAALTAEDAKDMISVCRENKVLFMEGFMYQFHPQHNRLKEIVASGEIGEVKSVRASLFFFLENQTENIRMNSSLGGGSLYDVGCYCIHAIRHLTGSEPVRVIASNRIHPVYQVDTSITGMLELDNGITALFDAAMDRVKTETYELIGTKGMIEVKRAFTPHLFQGDGILVVTNENGEERSEHLQGDPYKLEVEYISACILSGAIPDDRMEDTIHNLIAMDACTDSILRKAFVYI